MDGILPREGMASASASPMPMTVAGLSVGYDGNPAIADIHARFPARSSTAIIGPNGAGKSTLLKAALGLIPGASGDVRFFGQPLAVSRARVAYVPQRASVDWDFPIDVRGVAAMGLARELGPLGRISAVQRQRVADALDRVGMADLAERQIGQLSGGQQQRVFLARALVQNADLYLLDEPLAGVDAATEMAIVAVLKALVAEGRAVVAVHHDLSTVHDYFDRVLLLNRRVIAEGAVADAFTEENLRRTYLGKITVVDASRSERAGSR